MKILVACAAFALLGACAPNQEIERVPEVDAKMADTFASTKSIVYQRAIVRNNRGEGVVTVQGGLACVPHVEGTARSEQFAATDQEYENTFQDEFAKAGYRIARTVGSGDLFSDKKDIPADFRIAGVITKPKMNVCFPFAGFGNFRSGRGEASMTVEWQVWSNTQKAVVYTSVQKGYMKLDSSIASPGRELSGGAFARAVRGLLADEQFIAIVNGGETKPIVSAGGTTAPRT
jgi:serine protease Do